MCLDLTGSERKQERVLDASQYIHEFRLELLTASGTNVSPIHETGIQPQAEHHQWLPRAQMVLSRSQTRSRRSESCALSSFPTWIGWSGCSCNSSDLRGVKPVTLWIMTFCLGTRQYSLPSTMYPSAGTRRNWQSMYRDVGLLLRSGCASQAPWGGFESIVDVCKIQGIRRVEL